MLKDVLLSVFKTPRKRYTLYEKWIILSAKKNRVTLSDNTLVPGRKGIGAKFHHVLQKSAFTHTFYPQFHYFPAENFYIIYNLNDKDRKSTRLNSSHVAISYAV